MWFYHPDNLCQLIQVIFCLCNVWGQSKYITPPPLILKIICVSRQVGLSSSLSLERGPPHRRARLACQQHRFHQKESGSEGIGHKHKDG